MIDSVESEGRYRSIHCWDHYNTRTDIPALPFCKVVLKAKRPQHSAYPKVLETLGDHLKKRRLDLKLLQREVAQKIGISEASIHNWERGHATPSLCFMPRIIEFLGYNPLETPTGNLCEKIKHYRQILGFTQKALAKKLKIDPTTLARWEKRRGMPSQVLLEKIVHLFNSPLSISLKPEGPKANTLS